jgi:hypothetical protein
MAPLMILYFSYSQLWLFYARNSSIYFDFSGIPCCSVSVFEVSENVIDKVGMEALLTKTQVWLISSTT